MKHSVILLGAGASYGSVDVTPYCPPLGNGDDGLFKHLVDDGGIAASLDDNIKNIFCKDFEKGMAEFCKDRPEDIMRFQREMALYFARFKPGICNVYMRLLSSIDPRRVIYASLNYDLLLELAAASLGFKISYDYKPIDKQIRIIKPHGSCNFWPDMKGINFQNTTFSNNNADIVGANVEQLSRSETIKKCSSEDSLAPVIAIYSEGKPVKVCPEFVSIQQKKWKEAVDRAISVFVIGVRVHNVDKHIWGALASTKAPVFYYGLDSDQDAFKKWRNLSQKSNAKYINKNFEQSLESIKCFI